MSEGRELARFEGADILAHPGHGAVLAGTFTYYDENGHSRMSQGFGYSIDAAFIVRFCSVFGIERKLSDCNGKWCWVTHTHTDIFLVEPLSRKDGTAFDVQAWQAWVQKRIPGLTPYELFTGETPDERRERERLERTP